MQTTRSVVFALFCLTTHSALAQAPAGAVDLSFDAGSAIMQPVYAAAIQPDGKVVIGGDFTVVNGATRNGVARLLANGATDLTFTNGLATLPDISYGRALALQSDGKVLVGGGFYYGIYGLLRLNPDGSRDTSFRLALQANVNSLALQPDGKVVAGGDFLVSGRSCLARVNGDGTLDTTFLSGLSGADSTVNAVALYTDGRVLIGGLFSSVNGLPRGGVARLGQDGTLDPTFSPTVNGAILSLVLQSDGKAIIAGNFTTVNGTTRNRIARLNPDGSLDGSFLSGPTGPDATVSAVALQTDGKVVIGGAFGSINGVPKAGLARLNADGSLDNSYGPGSGLSGNANCLALQPDGQVVAGGSFTAYNSVPRRNIARVTTTGAVDTSFSNGLALFATSVSCLVTQTDGKILVNGVAIKGLGRLNSNGSPDSTFLSLMAGANDSVNAMRIPQASRILAVGKFTTMNGSPCRALARLNYDGSLDSGFQQGIGGSSGYLNCLELQTDGKILVGGVFDFFRGTGRTNLARLNADGSLDPQFLNGLAGVDGPVQSLALQRDGKILIGGSFSTVNGLARSGLARLNANGSVDSSFLNGMTGVGGSVYAIAVQPDLKILIGGSFTSVNGTNAYHVARLSPDGSLDTNFNAGVISVGVAGIRSLALQDDGCVIIAGELSQIGNSPRNNIARLRPDGSVDGFLPSPQGGDGPVLALTLLDSTRVLLGGGFGSLSSTPRSFVARVTYRQPAVPLESALNNFTLRWTNDVVAPWQGQTLVSHDLVSSAQSGSIADNQSTTLRSSVTGPGCLSFWWKVSSEANYDYLTFTSSNIFVTNIVRISGEVDWVQQVICLPAGVHTLQWTYSKDVSVSNGRDAGFVDEVTFSPGNQPPVILESPASRTNAAGQATTFTARAGGAEPLRYQWRLNLIDIPGATNLTYSLSPVLPEHGGTYSLRVFNPYGEAFTTNAQLVVVPIRAVGQNDYAQSTVSMATVDGRAIAAGQYHSLILRRDGTIYAWGSDGSGQCSVPPALGPAIGIAGGGYHSLAVRADSTVAGWGDNTYGQASAPAGLTNVVAVSAGMWHSLALRADGTVTAWGDNSWGQTSTPSSLSNVVAIAAGGTHNLALRADGLVFAWGGNLDTDGFYRGQAVVPLGLNQVVAVGAGQSHSLAVKSDGSIVGWGDNSFGQLQPPTNLPPAIAVSGGQGHSLALLSDGTSAAWGDNFDGQCSLARTVSNLVAVAAGSYHSLVLFGIPPAPPELRNPVRHANQFSGQVSTTAGRLYTLEYKNSLAGTNWATLPLVRGNGAVQILTDPAASTPQRFYRVRQW
jgi:uncharacterized delta-60 repeat protein